ncbi:uncharacterized protein MONOS_18078 [Monocercomonoides exilis]|uniref:uncharacterized protein n=1 Tax=Monocercomonoides exilis TaxID=2049356 RepID=UPI00355A42D4|nr:hypothetical protein MONOS_18078 [Monocercomonoides exilis]
MIELIGDEIWRIVCGMKGSVVVVRGCGVEMGRGKEAGGLEGEEMCVGDCLEERGGWGRRGVREKVGEEEE